MMEPGIIDSAAGVTLLGCGGLIAVAMITRKDFSFLRGLLVWGGILALIGIFGSFIFGYAMGTWFSLAMIGLAGAAGNRVRTFVFPGDRAWVRERSALRALDLLRRALDRMAA